MVCTTTNGPYTLCPFKDIPLKNLIGSTSSATPGPSQSSKKATRPHVREQFIKDSTSASAAVNGFEAAHF